MVSYEDTAAMADWLARASGRVEVERLHDVDGTVTHMESKHAGDPTLL
jgi:hypothetical protein